MPQSIAADSATSSRWQIRPNHEKIEKHLPSLDQWLTTPEGSADESDVDVRFAPFTKNQRHSRYVLAYSMFVKRQLYFEVPAQSLAQRLAKPLYKGHQKKQKKPKHTKWFKWQTQQQTQQRIQQQT